MTTPTAQEEVHCDSLKPYLLPLEGASLPLHYFRKPEETVDHEKTWIVEKILGHRKNAKTGKLEWKVKWKDSDNVTWENISSFIGDIQLDWLRYNKEKKIPVDFSLLPASFTVKRLAFSIPEIRTGEEKHIFSLSCLQVFCASC